MYMRTTINLDDETFHIIRNLAKSNHQSISKTVAQLIRKGIKGSQSIPTEGRIETDALTGFPLIQSGKRISEADVRSLEDDA